jgi:hypothetical protein
MKPFVNMHQAQNWAREIKLDGNCTVLKHLETGLVAKYLITPFTSFYYQGVMNK